MLYMLIETFKPGSQVEIYGRLEAEGRRLPEGLRYINSWVDEHVARCFQLMECQERRLLDQWMADWEHLTDFEVVPLISSAEAKRRVLGSR